MIFQVIFHNIWERKKIQHVKAPAIKHRVKGKFLVEVTDTKMTDDPPKLANHLGLAGIELLCVSSRWLYFVSFEVHPYLGDDPI